VLDAADVVGDLWSVPAYLRRCAPWLSREQVRRLQRADATAWTESDLPLLDAARQRIGDPATARRARQRQAELAGQREQLGRVIDELIAADDSELLLMTSLRQQDLRDALVDEDALPHAEPDLLAGPFAHVIVDEAQELTDAQWQMVLQRCPSRSITVVGDRAQARHGFAESWQQRLERIGLNRIRLATLTINYRTPAEVMAEAEPLIRAALPDANVPISIRRNGIPVRHGAVSELDALVDGWLAEHATGTACVISADPRHLLSADGSVAPNESASDRVRRLSPELVKGLEFDLVIVVEPPTLGEGIEAAVDRYVAMTRATQQLVVLGST